MRFITLGLVLTGLLLLVSCTTPDSRIADNRSAYDKFSPDIQQKIRAGQVEVGFTQEMVLLALGAPASKFTRKTEAGDTEVWSYRDESPRFSFGVGVGSGGSHSAVGGGLGISSGGYDPEERIRLEFRAGVVAVVDVIKRK